MGEAKKRRENDPFYGLMPKNGKGIIISNPMAFNEDGSLNVISSDLDPIELRRAVLFWERIEWPSNRLIHVAGSEAEVKFLSGEGIMSRPDTGLTSGNTTDIAKAHVGRFVRNEEAEPGQWCMSEGPSSFVFAQPRFSGRRAPLVSLYRAIPLPDRDVPLEDLLDFKRRRRDELKSLRITIDGFYSNLIKAEDTDFELMRLTTEIDTKCKDLMKVSKESGIAFRFSDLSINFSGNMDLLDAALRTFLMATAGSQFGLTALGGIIGGASSLKLELSTGFSIGRKNNVETKNSPYRFVSALHDEFISS